MNHQQHITEQTRLLSSHKSDKDYYDNVTHHQLQHQPQQQLQQISLIHRNIQSIQPVPLSRGSSSSTTTTHNNYDTLAKDSSTDKYNEINLKNNISVDEFAIYQDLNHPTRSINMSDGYLHDSNMNNNNPSTKALRTGRQRKKTASRTKGVMLLFRDEVLVSSTSLSSPLLSLSSSSSSS